MGTIVAVLDRLERQPYHWPVRHAYCATCPRAFSRTLESVDWSSRLEPGDPVEVVTKLKAKNRRQAGGGRRDAGRTDRAAGLVDEYRIVVTPTAVGGGTPFFPTLPSWISLRLLENRTFPGGTVLLRYEAKHD
jgi:dihydrofolate reductase